MARRGEQRTWATRGKDDASDLSSAFGAIFANLNDRFWFVDVIKSASSACNDCPGFTEDVNPSRNPQGVIHQVGARVKEDYLASSELQRQIMSLYKWNRGTLGRT